jgi:hypothetical protein
VTFRRLSFCAAVVFATIAVLVLGKSLRVTGVAYAPGFADRIGCDLSQYQARPGLTATIEQDVLAVTWTGQDGPRCAPATPSMRASRSFASWRSARRAASGSRSDAIWFPSTA